MSRNSCKGCEYSQKCELVKMTKEERKRREEIEEEIKKRPVPPILKPHVTGFRGFSETFSKFIKTKEGQVISV